MTSVRLPLGMAVPASFGFAEGLGVTSISSGFFSFFSQSAAISALDGVDNEQMADDLVDV